MLLLSLRGTPTLYYGDELGIVDGFIPPNLVHDPAEKNLPGLGMGRDPERTPMQWDTSDAAGFTTGTPWLPSTRRLRADCDSLKIQSPRPCARPHRAKLLMLPEASPPWQHRRSHLRPCLYRRSLDSILYTSSSTPTTTNTANCPEGHILVTTILDGDGAHVQGDLMLEAGEGVVILLVEP